MRVILFLLSTILVIISLPAQAVLEIEITRSTQDALPIAIVPFGRVNNISLDTDIAAIIRADLARSGRFRNINPEDMLEQPTDYRQIRFTNWRILDLTYMAIGSVRQVGTDYQIDFRLVDIFREKQVLGQSFRASGKDLRKVAHSISDLIYQAITGEPGAFNTRIAYITAQLNVTPPKFQLEIADADGYNPRAILQSPQPILSPAWSPDGRRLAYVSLENRYSEIYIHDITRGQRERVAAYQGLNGAPAWSPDGRYLALTLSTKGNADIFILELATKTLQQITDHWAIDTEPVWTPDGRKLIFTSGRSGNPQIYEINLANKNIERLSFTGSYNASPAISEDGHYLTFVHREQSNYQIAVLDLKNGLFRVLTDGRLDESPSFAPNSSMILYASQEAGRGVLAAVSLDGQTRQRLTATIGDVREPRWGPQPRIE